MLLKSNSLKSRLILLFIIFSCVPLLIVTTINNVTQLKTLKETSVNSNLQLSQQIGAGIKRNIDDNQGINATLANMPVIKAMQTDQMNSVLKNFQDNNPQFELIAVLDKNGNQIARSSGKLGNRADRDYFKAAIGGQSYASNAYISATTNQLCVTVSNPIRNDNGEIVGVVASDITLKSIWDIADNITIGKTGYMDVVDSTGIVIAHPDKDRVMKKENFSALPYVASVISGKSGTVEADSSQQSDCLIAYAPVENYNWGITFI